MPERRVYSRIPLDSPNFVKVRLSTGKALTMILSDISCGGAHLILPPRQEALPDVLGMVIVLLGLPPMIDRKAEGLAGTVSWLSPERCGVSFAKSLNLNLDTLKIAFEV